MFKRILGTVLLVGFITYMAHQLQQNVIGMGKDSYLFIAFVVVVLLMIVMLIWRILTQ